MPDQLHQLTRRSFLAGAALLAVAAAHRIVTAGAQEATPAAIATPAAGNNIRPTGVGDVPSTGARRPGPANVALDRLQFDTIAPVGLAVEAAGIDAGIEALRVVDGAMQDPSGPWVVAWYENLGALGAIGNVVMAGHIDYWNVGPAVFYNLSTLGPGDEIVVTGDDGNSYPFAVEWVRQYDSASMPLDEVAGPTANQSLTLITCGGAFDYVNGLYLQRTVVRANRAGAPAQV
ncbi:MAG: peptidase sortase [Thermomicrobiales bacterium]|nr:peptidase sortase [Thermomicrobiales bacterium]